ncbi:MAG: hypothetical protein Q8P51_11090 [Ignavibacteria bacterium]|nr:hypothetical protein [Ignavibacteria bacterium]
MIAERRKKILIITALRSESDSFAAAACGANELIWQRDFVII